MHVLINGWFFGSDTAGSGQYLHHLLLHLPRVAPDARFTLLLPADKELDASLVTFLGELPPNLAVEFVVTNFGAALRLPSSVIKLWWEQVCVPLAARQQNADLIWVPYWAAPYWQPRPTVVTVHDLIPSLLPAYRGGWLNRIYTSLVSATALRSAAVLTVSHASAKDIVTHLGVSGDRVYAIHNGPNQMAQERKDAAYLTEVRKKYALPERFFLYLGGFDVRKNLRTMLLAYERYLALGGSPDVQFVIAGRLPREDSAFAPDPKKIADELGLMDQVHFCGWVEDAEKPALYALSMGYIFPSVYEGFGMMVLEAMSAGTPVVTSGE